MNCKNLRKILAHAMLTALSIAITQCTSPPAWQTENQELIKQHNLTERKLSGLPKTSLTSNLEAAKVTSLDSLSRTELYPGVKANIFWGTGIMVATLQLDPNAKIEEEELPADKFVFVLEGSVDQLVNGSIVNMIGRKREEPDGIHSATPRTNFVYLEKGAKTAVTAGAFGAKVLEIHSPVRLDYLQKTGVKKLPDDVADIASTQTPNVRANIVYDLYDVQLTKLAPGAHSRLVSGK
ncbi:MAG TPA: gluconolaconase, partial [Chryseolinea sp.]|nr:gluconolaconase [Chryseolinea sp.]